MQDNVVVGAIAVKSKLAVEHFTVVVEDDGSSVCDDVMTAVIKDGEKLGTLRTCRSGHARNGRTIG